ncbi:MAG: CxxC-x17-CxxC domain-containing protein [Candidatus Shapirobacteria bacterium]
MRNFRDNNRSGNRRDSGRPAMHDAVCDECGRNCQVPFRPSGDKPIYCSDCFEKRGGGDERKPDRRGSYRRDFGGRDSNRSSLPRGPNEQSINKLSQNIEALNANLAKIIGLLEDNKKPEKPKKSKKAKKK